MKYWKSIIILILTIFLFSIASVCASDANDTAIASEDTDGIIQASENQENGMQGSDDDEAVLSEDDSSDNSEKTVTNHTFKAIENAIESDCTIYLEPGTYTGNSRIYINQKSNIKIIGNSTILDAQGKTNIFSIRESNNITIQNITFINAYNTDGGAIEGYGNCNYCNISNCTFTNNHASSYGGAIRWSKECNYCSISNCIFINNTAGTDGGAIEVDNSCNYCSISNCTFTNNTADYGGAIRWTKECKYCSISNCTFTNNHADKLGGAIEVDNSCNYYNISNCIFINNTAGTDGGAIKVYNSCTYCNISNCTFTNNHAGTDGGAIGLADQSDNGQVSNCIFINNTADRYGGAIELAGHSSNVQVSNCIFINNTADRLGGAILLDGHSNNGQVSNCAFINNHANDGGAITWDISDNGRVNGCIFINNTATIGGTIYVFACELNADYNWFGNNATNYKTEPKTKGMQMGSWLFLNATNNQNNIKFFMMSYNGTTISEYDNTLLSKINLMISATGGILDKSIVGLDETVKFIPTESGINGVTAQIEDVTQTIEVTNGDFDVLQASINHATSSVINLTRNYEYNEFDTITDGVIINRTLTINGNGYTIDAKGKSRIFYIEADNVTIENLIIKNANATGDGGSIYFKEYGSVENCNFINNTAKNSGGAIGFATNGNVENCNFADNKAGDWGGSIYFERTGSVTNCDFTNNAANALGGAVLFINAGNVTNCSFDDNTASTLGGAVYFSRDGEVTNCSFTNNNASSNGGAIYFAEDSATRVMNCKFSNNTAANGGAIFNQRGHTTVDTCIFKTGNDTINSNAIILSPTLNVDNFTTTYNSREKLTFDLKTNSSMPVNGNISISIYYKNNGSWVGNYSCLSGKGWTVDLPAGSYYALFHTEYAGFEPINRTITVNKLKTSLAAKAVTATYNVNKYLVITLKDANGKPLTGVKVTVNLNCAKEYTTDKNGQFKVATKGLAPKKYTAKITFNGNTNYVKSTKSVKVTIKKATPKLTAKKKTFKVKKAKKYTITLKTNKKKALKKGKVTLTVKVKGKKIKITKKTNKKGKATFNLKKLNKKGRYTAVVKFAGNKYYKAKTVKAKITVR